MYRALWICLTNPVCLLGCIYRNYWANYFFIKINRRIGTFIRDIRVVSQLLSLKSKVNKHNRKCNSSKGIFEALDSNSNLQVCVYLTIKIVMASCRKLNYGIIVHLSFDLVTRISPIDNYRVSHCKLNKIIWLWEKERKIFLKFYGVFSRKHAHFDI